MTPADVHPRIDGRRREADVTDNAAWFAARAWTGAPAQYVPQQLPPVAPPQQQFPQQQYPQQQRTSSSPSEQASPGRS